MNKKKTPAELVWTDGDGDKLWVNAPSGPVPTLSAAYVGASRAGVYLTAAQCHEVAAHFTALADAHEESMSRSAPALPTESGAVIVPADGHEYIEVSTPYGSATYYCREAVYDAPYYYGIWWRDGKASHNGWRAECITPGTWKVAEK